MIYILITFLLLILDQITKLWSRKVLALRGSIPIIKDFFHLSYVENRGAAFGILSGRTTLFLIVTILAIAILMYYAKGQRNNRFSGFLNITVTFIIAGALGNLIDRTLYGFVTDMIDFRGLWKFVFNVADCYVVCGTAALIFYILKFDNSK